jgi:ABC-2 type transport system permease protein
MRIFTVQLQKELLEMWRTRRLIIVIAVLVAFGMLSPILAKITPDLLKSMSESQMQGIVIQIPEPSTRDAIDQFVKNLTQFGLLLAVLMSFGTIVGERERGQAALVLAHPLPRSVFVLAKFVALAILFGAGLALSGTVAYIYTTILFDAPDVAGYMALIGAMFLWLLALMSVSLLASVLGRTTISAGGIAFVFVVLFLLTGTFTNLAPGAITSWGRNLAAAVDTSAQWGALFVTLALTAAGVIASAVLLRTQEID